MLQKEVKDVQFFSKNNKIVNQIGEEPDNNVVSDSDTMEVGSQVQVRAEVYLGPFEPKDVSVQIYSGRVDTKGEIVAGQGIKMEHVEPQGNSTYIFQGAITCQSSGQHGYSVRVLPKHEDLGNPFIMNLITWI